MNLGFNVEKELVFNLNKKKYYELTPFLKDVLITIFPFITNEDIIYSRLLERTQKPDIYIKCRDQIKYISIKSGKTNSVHFEKINELTTFLASRNISNETIETILLFHYGDGTLNGTGETRLLFEDLFPLLNKRIQLANIELNQKEIVDELIDRFIFNGIESKILSVDYILHGNQNYGVLCSKEKIKKFILNKNYNHVRTLHVGPLTIQPFLRDIHDVSKNKYKREYVQIKWHYMASDLEFIEKYVK